MTGMFLYSRVGLRMAGPVGSQAAFDLKIKVST